MIIPAIEKKNQRIYKELNSLWLGRFDDLASMFDVSKEELLRGIGLVITERKNKLEIDYKVENAIKEYQKSYNSLSIQIEQFVKCRHLWNGRFKPLAPYSISNFIHLMQGNYVVAVTKCQHVKNIYDDMTLEQRKGVEALAQAAGITVGKAILILGQS